MRLLGSLPKRDLRQTFAVPRQEPWARHVDDGSRKSIWPAGVQVKGPVTD